SLLDSLDLALNPNYAQTSQKLQFLATDLSAYNFYDQLDQINMPTLLVYGDYDPLTDVAAPKLKGAIRQAELTIIDNCGHFPFIEKPKEFYNAVNEFLAND
ncbi:MAG: alpha/beta hydrolase, partial [Fulvivirga sp.]|nr:alpha/beta hydrolase [Fulvivirga sp.]